MSIPVWIYFIVSSAAVGAWLMALTIRRCNTWTRPDDALGSALKFFHHGAYVVRSLQYALAHYRNHVAENRADLAQAMMPVRMEER